MPCRNCGGSGEERQVQRSVFGQFVSVAPCRACGGEGRIIEEPCTTCRGEGRVRDETEIDVEVPAGVSSENFLTLRGQGNAGPRGGPKGDIIVLLEVQDDPSVQKGRGEPPLRASRSPSAKLPWVTRWRSPPWMVRSASRSRPGSRSGEVLRLERARDFPGLHGRGRGDQLVRVRLWTPQKLIRDQERILQELRELEESPPEDAMNGEERGFWSRVKEAFS